MFSVFLTTRLLSLVMISSCNFTCSLLVIVFSNSIENEAVLFWMFGCMKTSCNPTLPLELIETDCQIPPVIAPLHIGTS